MGVGGQGRGEGEEEGKAVLDHGRVHNERLF